MDREEIKTKIHNPFYDINMQLFYSREDALEYIADYIEAEIEKAYIKGCSDTVLFFEKHTKVINKDTGEELPNALIEPTSIRFLDFVNKQKAKEVGDTHAPR